MSGLRKITVDVHEETLKKARQQTGKGVSETVREGLRIIAQAKSYESLSKMRGKVKIGYSWQELKDERD